MSPRSRWLTSPWSFVLFLAIVAAAFRYPRLDTLPPGLNFDEGGEGVAALDVARGDYRVWWPIGGGKEPLMAYLVQPFFWVFGPTRVALRAYTATLGVGTVLATFFLARELGGAWSVERGALGTLSTLHAPRSSLYDTFLPTLAGLGLATAFWHVAYSRIAFRALSNPLVEALALAFLWRGLRRGRWRDFIVGGVFLGGLLYTYLAGRFVPLALVVFFTGQALIAWRQGERPILAQYWQQLAAFVAVAALVVLPAALFFAQNPAAFVERAGSVSIFSPAMNRGNFLGTAARATASTIGTFLNLSGDPNCLANLPLQSESPSCTGAAFGKSMLGPVLAVAFVAGVAVCLWRWRRLSHLFLLTWWPVMLLPAILAPEGVPHHLRLIGTAPATYILVAIGLTTLLDGLWQGFAKLTRGGRPDSSRQPLYIFGLGLVVLAVIGWQTGRDYFVRWPARVEPYLIFDVYAEDLAQLIAADADPGVAYVIPMDLRAAGEARHYSLDFLLHGYAGASRWGYLVVDEATVAGQLTDLAAEKSVLKVVRWTVDKHQEADAKELVSYLLASTAELTGIEPFRAYSIETYRLPGPATVFKLPEATPTVSKTFGDPAVLQLEAAAVGAGSGATALPGSRISVVAQFVPLAPMAVDYKASLRLVGPDGERVAQKDRVLLHNWHQGTSLWPREVVNEYYLLSLPPEAIPGNYELRLVIYDPQTLAPLAAAGLDEVPLGNVTVGD